LEGVRVAFLSGACVVTQAEAAAGIRIPYSVEVDTALGELKIEPLDAGRCSRPAAHGLALFPEVVGDKERWCQCDVGLCPPAEVVSKPKPGRYTAAIDWNGRNFAGPSDTGMTPGALFPPGRYRVQMQAKGTRDGVPFEVRAWRDIYVVR